MKTLNHQALSNQFSELFSIITNALPVCIAVGLAAGIGLVDVQLAGNLGAAVQAGVGIGDQALFFAALTGTGIAQGAGSLIARATGAGRHREAQVFASAALILAALLGASASIFTFFCADSFLALFSNNETVRQSGSVYLKLCSIANLPYCLMLTQSAILRAAGKSFSTVFPWFVATAVSVGLSIYLTQICPFGKAFTLQYIALAWNLGAIFAALAGHCQLQKAGFSLLDKTLSPQAFFEKSRQILNLGLPIAATEAAWLSSNFFMYIILAQMSSADDAQAAWTIRLKIEEIAATPAILAINMTAASLVGQLVGARSFACAKKTTNNAALLSALLLFGIGAAVFFNTQALASHYASTAKSAQYAQVLLAASLFVYPLTAFYMTGFGALEGAGSTFKPMLAVIAGLYLLRIPMSAWLALQMEMGMTGIVLSIVISHAAVALCAVSQTKSFFEGKSKSELASKRDLSALTT